MKDPDPIVKRYVTRFAASLTTLSEEERYDAVREIESHFAEAAVAGEPMESVIAKLGPAERMAARYESEAEAGGGALARRRRIPRPVLLAIGIPLALMTAAAAVALVLNGLGMAASAILEPFLPGDWNYFGPLAAQVPATGRMASGGAMLGLGLALLWIEIHVARRAIAGPTRRPPLPAAILVPLLLLAAPALAQREVEGNVILSDTLPAAALTFDASFTYAGTQSFELYEVADAEQHFFVDADEDGRVKRIYWIQFEGYHDDNDHAYDYSDEPERATIGGVEWFVRPMARRVGPPDGDSDGARAHRFLLEKGYTLPAEVAGARYVYLIGDPPRDEVMIIYMEDLAGLGVTMADVSPGGARASEAGVLAAQVVARGIEGFTLEPR